MREPPTDIVRRHVRLTLQPVDGPLEADKLERLMQHMGSDDMLLFSTDYPHWQFDGEDVLPSGLSDVQLRKLLTENALRTYPRLKEPVA